MEQDYMVALRNGLGKSAFEGLQDTYFTRSMSGQRASYSATAQQDDYASQMQRAGGQMGSGSEGGYALHGKRSETLYSPSSGNSSTYSFERKTRITHNLDSIADKECVSCGKANNSPYPHCDDCLMKLGRNTR